MEHFRQFPESAISYQIIQFSQAMDGMGVALVRLARPFFILSQTFALVLCHRQSLSSLARRGPFDFAQG